MKTVIVPKDCTLVVNSKDALARFHVFMMNGSTLTSTCGNFTHPGSIDEPDVDCPTCKHREHRMLNELPCKACKIEYVDTTYQEYERDETVE